MFMNAQDALYWRLLKEAHDAELAYRSVKDMRYLTNAIAFRRDAARRALADFVREKVKA